MIDSQKVLYSAGGNDECYTPAYGVIPILKYIPKNWVVWCVRLIQKIANLSS